MLQGVKREDLTDYENEVLIDKWVDDCSFVRVGVKTTVCLLTINNGFEIVGSSSCVDPSSFDGYLGKKYALKDALNRLDELQGFSQHLEV